MNLLNCFVNYVEEVFRVSATLALSHHHYLLPFLLFLKTGSHSTAQAGIELMNSINSSRVAGTEAMCSRVESLCISTATQALSGLRVSAFTVPSVSNTGLEQFC